MVEASDKGYPEAHTDDAALTVIIERDVEIPEFTRPSYRVSISENLPINGSVATVKAQLTNVVVRNEYN